MVYNDYNSGNQGELPIYEDTHSTDANYSQRLRNYQNVNMGATPLGGPAPQNVTREVKSLKNLMVYEPCTETDATTIIDFIKRKEPAIINLNGAEPETAQRILDFSSGAVYALSGSVHKIAENIFLLLPTGVEITNFDRGNDD